MDQIQIDDAQINPGIDSIAKTGEEFLTFSMQGEYYAVNIMQVREIRGWSKPTPLPHAPPFMRGVINLRGTVLPILDLSSRLNGTNIEARDRNVVIVVEVEDQVAGLLVDAVSDIVALAPEDLQDPPKISGENGHNCIDALALVDDMMIRTLDLGTIISHQLPN